MTALVVFDAVSGEILRTGNAPEGMADCQRQAGEAVLTDARADDASQYVDVTRALVVDKPAMGVTLDKSSVIANGVDTCTLTGIPAGVMARIEGGGVSQTMVVADGVLSLSFDTPDRYTVSLTKFPYLTRTFVIEAS